MSYLDRRETIEFLETFYKGLLEVGLLEPLLKLEAAASANVKKAAQSMYAALISGVTPQVAVGLMSPPFSFSIESLIVLGFEQSNIDFVIKDILLALDEKREKTLDEDLEHLLGKYSPLKTEAICVECWINEIQKILKRAHAEQSSQVIISFEKGYLIEKFIAAKLVTITEPAILAVYFTLQRIFSEYTRREYARLMNIEVKEITKHRYLLTSSEQSLTVVFSV